MKITPPLSELRKALKQTRPVFANHHVSDKDLATTKMNQHFSPVVKTKSRTAAKMNTDAKPMFLVNGVSPLPFSSGCTGRICREMDIQGMVKTQRHNKHCADHHQHLWCYSKLLLLAKVSLRCRFCNEFVRKDIALNIFVWRHL